MEFDVVGVVSLLRDLEQRFATVRRRLGNLVDVVGGGRMTAKTQRALIAAMDDVRYELKAAHGCVCQLHRQLHSTDGLGDFGDHLAELAIRGTRMVVLTQIERLRGALVPRTGPQRSVRWQELADALHEFARQAEQEFERITYLLNLHRSQISTTQKTQYESCARAAYRSMKRLRLDPVFDGFLRKGLTATELPEIQQACRQIATVFTIELGATFPGSAQPWLISNDNMIARIADDLPAGTP